MSGSVLRRVGLIGDVHGEDGALAAALDFLAGQSLDALLCTGDLPAKTGVGDTDRCCRLLRDAGVLTIRGNHDRWALENDAERVRLGLGDEWPLRSEAVAFLRTLPPTRTLETVGGSLYLCHGVGTNDMEGIYPGGDDEPIMRGLELRGILPAHCFLVAGHTHHRLVRKLGGLTVINPGTLRWEEKPGFAVADFGAGTVHFYNLAPFTNEITPARELTL